MCKERVSFVSYCLYSRKEYRLYPTVCTQGKSIVCILLFVHKESVSKYILPFGICKTFVRKEYRLYPTFCTQGKRIKVYITLWHM